MSKVDQALEELKKSGNPDALYEACRSIPHPRMKPAADPRADEDVDPVNPEFDKITAARVIGVIDPEVYRKCIELART